ncbi:hypothetical protein [Spirosoma spitsbergense]|uniref:hypothetical protein n=1 Tax=Spirosoma spitsbergense TaxID=431554 RepID=UPI0003624F74|nr:hypothetical protein [Spirosoma spitsbergense]
MKNGPIYFLSRFLLLVALLLMGYTAFLLYQYELPSAILAFIASVGCSVAGTFLSSKEV